MVQINAKTQFIVMAISLVAFIALQATVGFGWAFIPLFIFIGFAIAFILFGTISSTSKILSTGDYTAAEQNLNLTFKPTWLLKMYRGYYYQLKGFIEIQKKNLDAGETFLLQARDMGLPTNTDKATVALQLASLNFNKRSFQKASGYIREIKNLDIKEPTILEQVKQLEQAIKAKPSMAQIMSMQGMNMRGRTAKPQQNTEKKRGNYRTPPKRKKRK